MKAPFDPGTSMSVLAPLTAKTAPATDILRWPLAGRVLRWRRFRTTAQLVLLVVAIVVVLDGLFGPDLAPRNLSTVLTWIHYRGLLIGALLAVGNVFCGACPMILVRDVGRRVHRPTRRWPHWLRRKWLALGLFVAVLLAYELFDLWALPAATAWLVVGYFGAALLVDTMFTGAAFCKHVCPVGQFNFIASTISPLEVGVRDPGVCRSCTTVDCIKGRAVQSAPVTFVQRGCELALFLPSKVGNLDCTFCLDCVQACPHDNVGLHLRVPGEELADDRRRSSLGRLARRPDLAAFALVFTFGALLNAFAMAAPVYSVEAWLANALHTKSEAVVLTLLFLVTLVILPLSLTSLAAWITRRATAASTLSVRDIAVRFAFAFVPFGVGVWLAHYGFHFLTGVGTILPVAQNAVIDATGRAFLGEPSWRWLGLRPGDVFPVQLGSVLLGALGSVMLVHRISERDHSPASARAAVPWGVLIIALTGLALWILVQPMEMRAVNLGG
jgi:polyferredoxin